MKTTRLLPLLVATAIALAVTACDERPNLTGALIGLIGTGLNALVTSGTGSGAFEAADADPALFLVAFFAIDTSECNGAARGRRADAQTIGH